MERVTESMSNRFRKSLNPDLLHVATLGRVVGLKGDIKLNLHTDFPEQFVKGSTFQREDGSTITLQSYNPERELARIIGFDTPESVKILTNAKLFTTHEATRERCKLGKDEFFWFDLPGLNVFDGVVFLGSVQEIERIGAQDYLLVKTDGLLVEKGLSESFLIPYIDHFVTKVELEMKKINVNGGVDLLEAS